MPQKSKIAQLPDDVRDILTKMLDSGATEQECADFLNAEIKRSTPDLDEIVKDGPISHQNVHNWKQSAYEALKAAREIQKALCARFDAQAQDAATNQVINWLTAKLASEILELDRNPLSPDKHARRMRELVEDATKLKRVANETLRLQAENRKVDIAQGRLDTLCLALRHKVGFDTERQKLKIDEMAATGKFPAILEPAPRAGYSEHRVLRESLSDDQYEKLKEILTEQQLTMLGKTRDEEALEQDDEEECNEPEDTPEQGQLATRRKEDYPPA